MAGSAARIDIDVADAFEMGDDGDAAFALHPLDQRAPAARHDHVDEVGHGEHQPDRRAVARRHELHRIGRQARRRRWRARRHAAIAPEEWKLSEPPRRIAALPARRHSAARVGGDVGARLVDDADDAQRHAHARDVEPVGPGPARELGADGIGQIGHLLEPPRHRLDARRVEQQPVEHGGRERPLPPRHRAHWRRGSRLVGADRGRRAAQRRGLARRLGARQGRRRDARARAQRAHLAREVRADDLFCAFHTAKFKQFPLDWK